MLQDNKNITTLLSKSTVFRNIPENEIAGILKKINYRIRTFLKGDIIVGTGDKAQSMYIVLEGEVEGLSIDDSGKIVKIESIFAGQTFALGFLFADNANYQVDVNSHTDSVVFIVDKQDIISVLLKNSTFAENFIREISNKFIFLVKKIKFLTHNTISEKLIKYIQEQVKKNNSNEFIPDKTGQQLAEYMGVTRPALARCISDLEKQGIIRKEGKKIILLKK